MKQQLKLVMLLFVLPGLVAQSWADTEEKQIAMVPFGNRIDERIFNYNRTTPSMATSGVIREGGIELLVREGFNSVIDLRTPQEGVAAEAAAMQKAGLAYSNIPIGKQAPSDDDVRKFASIFEDKNRGLLLLHCASANRVGTLWAMYRVSTGVALQTALEEGRTVGMKPARESNVIDFAARLRTVSGEVP